MHSTHLRVTRLTLNRRQELAAALQAALPRLNDSAESALAYVALCTFWGFVLFLIISAIGS